MLMQRGWSYFGDRLRDDIISIHPEINIVDFDLYNVKAFNRCENENEVLLAFKSWESVHPLIKIIPVEWDYTMPFGILHSKTPSDKVKRLIKAIRQIKKGCVYKRKPKGLYCITKRDFLSGLVFFIIRTDKMKWADVSRRRNCKWNTLH